MSTFVRLCRSALLLLSAALATAHAARAQQTLRVPQDFPTIQTAINAAHTGDTVLVSPGTYFENLTIDTKEILLTSTAGSSTTTLDGSHLGPVLKITNTTSIATTITGFTIQNGSPLGSSFGSTSVGPAGVLIANAGAQITNSTFQKNTGINLGVINGSLTLTASSLSTAPAPGAGCAVSAVNPSTGVYLSGTSTVLIGISYDSGLRAPADAIGKPHPTILRNNTIFGDGTTCSGVGIQAFNLGQPLLIRSNTIRNNAVALTTNAAPVFLIQNLIYDNASGALHLIDRAKSPNVDPATTQIVNNTIVNNLTSPAPATDPASITDIFLDGTAAHIQFINNILVGTTAHPVLTCASRTPSLNDTPLLFANNDLFNTTRAANSLAAGDCFPGLTNPLATNGNLTVDPQLTGSTDLLPLPSSPVIDAGNSSAPGLIFLPFASAAPTLGLATEGAAFLDDAVASYGLSTVLTTPFFDVGGTIRFLDGSASGHNTIDIGAYEAPRAANSRAGDSPSATVLSSSAYLMPPGPVTFQALNASFAAYGLGPTTFFINGVQQATIPEDSTGILTFQTTLNSPGLYAIVASTPSSTSLGYPASLSPPIYVRVTEAQSLANTTLTIAASPTTQVLNQPITLTIHLGSTTTVSGPTQPGPVPPGDLTLSEAGTILSTLQPDTSGLATFTIPHPTAGNHTYTVTYAGTTTYSAATASTAVSITAPVATSLTATATPNPAPLNYPVLCQAQVVAASGPAPTGIVTFTDGATPEGTIKLTSPGEQGLVGLPLYNLSLGLHTITVTFTGDPGFSPSTGTCTVNVGGDATRTSLVSSLNPAPTTVTVFYLATVANTASFPATPPAGSVSLSEGNTLLATAPLVPDALGSSTASLPADLTTPGIHILTATYLPATSATFTSAATLTETITAPPSITTILTATPNPATISQTVTLSAAVTSAAAIPGPATITFTDGATVLGTVPLPPVGPATLSIATLSLGTHQITAALRTTASTLSSTSTPLPVQVNGVAATLSLAASPSPTAFATAPVTLTASLLPGGPLPPGASLAGTVTFFDGPLPLGIAPLSTAGQATLITTTLAAGSHSLSASFSGTSIFAPVSSSALSESILLNATSTQLIAPAQSIAFAPVTLAAHVVSSATATRIFTSTCTPACNPITVTFVASTPAGFLTLGTVPVDASGSATLTIHPAAGSYGLVATFSGSALFNPSSSAASTLTVAPVTTALTLSANPNPAYQHSAIALSAVLTAPGIPASALSGSITFLEGSTTLGSASLAAAQSFAYTPTTVGAHTLTAIFSGNASLSGSSATLTITVLPSDFVLTVKDPTLTIATTHHAPTAISINTSGALADLIDLSCTNLPANAHCTFSPATHDLTAANASTGTLTVDTDALLNYAAVRPPALPTNGSSGRAFTVLLALALPTTLLAGLTRVRRRHPGSSRPVLPHLLAVLLLSTAAITLAGCSGLYPPHVAPGTYTVTITGHARSSGIEHTVPLTLVVTP